MIKKIFHIIYNERRENSWIVVEIIAASIMLWMAFDPLFTLARHDNIEDGYDIDGTLNNLRTFTDTLAANSGRIEAMIGNLDKVTTDLAEANFVEQLDSTLTSLDSIIKTIEEGDGTAGMLINDKALYESLNSAGDNLAQLLEDLKANPMRYVHFSLFGKSEEQIAEKAAKKAAREQKRAEKKAANSEE